MHSHSLAQSHPIFDAHIHYSHDAVEQVPAADVIRYFKDAGVRQALVSSSNDEGTQKLLALAPEIVVPSLRPYRTRADLNGWVRDPAIIDYLKARLTRYRYAAIGEFHLYGDEADLPVPRQMIALAREYGLILHAHSDAQAVDRIFAQYPQALVIWAHAGFARPQDVATQLRKHANLWADLAFRSDMAPSGEVDPTWKEVFTEFPTRFMVGTDTFTPERLAFIPAHAQFTRQWLSSLPTDVARNIAFDNAARLMQQVWQPCEKTDPQARVVQGDGLRLVYRFMEPPRVGQALRVRVAVCGAGAKLRSFDATMPQHRHGMNYRPIVHALGESQAFDARKIEGIVLHMAGRWELSFDLAGPQGPIRLTDTLNLQ
jgi:hypothetical protein